MRPIPAPVPATDPVITGIGNIPLLDDTFDDQGEWLDGYEIACPNDAETIAPTTLKIRGYV